MNSKNILVGGVIVLIVIGATSFLSQSTSTQEANQSKKLTSVSSITHGHGLAVDAKDSSKVYIATHHGLLVLLSDKDLFAVGSKQDDYMGFSKHPTDSNIFFSSGHPATGGNIGFQKSEDGGFTWKKISDGQSGPVDFHAMAVSLANPNLIYGWFRGAIQRSIDGGKSWEKFPTNFVVVNLAADPKDENIVYAASPQGLMVSTDKGEQWNVLMDGFVSTLAVNPKNSQSLISFSEKQRLAKSEDTGKTWTKISESFSGETPLFLAFDSLQPDTIYTLTEKNSLYKSTDGANNWKKIR